MNSIDPKLKISSKQMDKVRYFLKTFKNLEWSGPAWYSHKKDENGFPIEVKLEYWHPLHLGTSASTDWEGEELIKIYKPLRKLYPKIGKEWVQGNIHSHHNMGAFFSSTDIDQCIDGANENFYYSLVVSTKPGKELHFGVSYPDQFGQVHVIEFDEIEIEEVKTKNPEWKEQAAFIKKNKSPETPYALRGYTSTGGQATLFGGQKEETAENTKQSRYEDHIDQLSYNGSFFNEEQMSWEKWTQFDNIMLDFDRGKLTKKQFNKKLKKLGVDEYGRSLS